MTTSPQQPGANRAPVVPVTSSKSWNMQPFREIVTAVISISILYVSLSMLRDTYSSGKVVVESAKTDEKQNAAELKAKSEAYGRQKDMLLYALAFLGTVTGYYLGRVPAELHAQQAQKTADNAQTQAASANKAAAEASGTAMQAIEDKQKIKRDTKETLKQVLPLVTASQQTVKTLGGAGVSQSVDLARAQREIEQLLERIG